jgi:hypothetical protein
MDRRGFIGTGLAALASAPAWANTAGVAALGFNQPDDEIRAFMRLFTTTAGEVSMSVEGIIHGKPPGEIAKPLVGFVSILRIRAAEIEPGVFRTEQREAMYYTDLATGGLLQEFLNPYTQETLVPVGYVSPTNVYFFARSGSYARALPPAPRTGKKVLDWRVSDTDLWVSEIRNNVFPSGISEEEFPRAYSGPERKSIDILTYRAKRKDFANARLASVPATVQMVTDGPWPLWLMMAKRPGGVIWNGFGQKMRDFSQLSDSLKRGCEEAYPGFLKDPWPFPEREFGTAAQLRRLRAAGKL